MNLAPGEVILVRFPFTDLTTAKLRPAVVLANHGQDLIIAGIFSLRPGPTKPIWVPVRTGDPGFEQTGLKADSVIKGERIAVVEQSVVVRSIGRLSESTMITVRNAIRIALNLG